MFANTQQHALASNFSQTGFYTIAEFDNINGGAPLAAVPMTPQGSSNPVFHAQSVLPVESQSLPAQNMPISAFTSADSMMFGWGQTNSQLCATQSSLAPSDQLGMGGNSAQTFNSASPMLFSNANTMPSTAVFSGTSISPSGPQSPAEMGRSPTNTAYSCSPTTPLVHTVSEAQLQSLSSIRMDRNPSSRQRMMERSRRYVDNAKNQIFPRTPLDTNRIIGGRVSKPSSLKQEIPKQRRERQRPQKLLCTQCDKNPAGFRGPHELQRHISSHHETRVKRYVCRDPRELGLRTNLVLHKSLEQCKHCREKKQYNVDYNAAAHLRRTHFQPIAPRGKKASLMKAANKETAPVEEVSPSMEDVKDWIAEIIVTTTPAKSGMTTHNIKPEQSQLLQSYESDNSPEAAQAEVFAESDSNELDFGNIDGVVAESLFETGASFYASSDYNAFDIPGSADLNVAEPRSVNFMDEFGSTFPTAYEIGNGLDLTGTDSEYVMFDGMH